MIINSIPRGSIDIATDGSILRMCYTRKELENGYEGDSA
jgi:hypothetical protein